MISVALFKTRCLAFRDGGAVRGSRAREGSMVPAWKVRETKLRETCSPNSHTLSPVHDVSSLPGSPGV